MKYLGYTLDAQTLHFEHENCPACSAEKDPKGRLVSKKYKWWEDENFYLFEIPIFDKDQKKIRYTQMLRSNFSSDEAYLAQLDRIAFLYCSRWPDCKYFVPIKNSVLLDNPSLLVDAQCAYRVN